MGYPQPDSDLSVINGGDYFRLNTLLASGGDIYESKQSGLGFAIGPESDIANVNIAYFDQQNRNFISQVGVAPGRSFVGRLDANNAGKYAPMQRPARVLIWPDDRWNPLLLGFFSPHGSGVSIIETPRLDVIEYFSDQPSSIRPQRRDKTWFYQTLFTGGAGKASTSVIVPYYGRRYAKILLQGLVASAGIDIAVTGQDFQQRNSTIGPLHPLLSPTNLLPATAYANVGGQDTFQFIVDGGKTLFAPSAPAANDINNGGMFDLLEVTVNNHDAGNADHQEFLLKIITSDIPGGSTS